MLKFTVLENLLKMMLFLFKHFSEKDFTWKGEVTQPNFKSFLDEPFDFINWFF